MAKRVQHNRQSSITRFLPTVRSSSNSRRAFNKTSKSCFAFPPPLTHETGRTFGPVCTKSSISFFNAFFILAARSRCSRICAAWRRSASSLKRCMLTGRCCSLSRVRRPYSVRSTSRARRSPRWNDGTASVRSKPDRFARRPRRASAASRVGVYRLRDAFRAPSFRILFWNVKTTNGSC